MELVLAACLTFTHWHVTPFTLNRNVNFFFSSSSSNSRRRQLSASFLFLVSLFFVSKIWLSWAYLAYYCDYYYFYFVKEKIKFFSSSWGEEENTHRAFLFAFQRSPKKSALCAQNSLRRLPKKYKIKKAKPQKIKSK